MCNLYRHEGAVEAIRQFAAAMGRELRTSPATGNLPPDYVGADSDGPILTNSDDGLLLDNARWGFPPAKQGAKPITNIRNLKSRWWRDVNRPYFLEAEHRCLVPFTRFAEWNAAKKANAWFRPVDQPAFFAGIWRPWTGERLVKVDGQKRRQRVTQDFTLYAFLTCEPNSIVAPIHEKAMPVVITSPEAASEWMAGGDESFALARPMPDDGLEIWDEGRATA